MSKFVWEKDEVVLTPAPAEKAEEWKGPGEKPHQYNPDPMMTGDCRVCGHTWEAHQK